MEMWALRNPAFPGDMVGWLDDDLDDEDDEDENGNPIYKKNRRRPYSE